MSQGMGYPPGHYHNGQEYYYGMEDAVVSIDLPDPFQKPLPTTDEQLHWKAEDVLGRPHSAMDDNHCISRYFARNKERKLAGMIDERQAMKLPPMLNELSLFTRASPYGDTADLYYHSPSDKIASHYAKASYMDPEDTSKCFSSPRKLAETSFAESLTGISKGKFDALSLAECEDDLKKLPGQFEETERTALSDAIMRYFYYIEHGVRDEEVAPLKEEWPIHVMQLVPPEPPRNVSQDYFENLIRDSMKEMEDDYYFSMKKAIVDYTLCNPFERQRLSMQVLDALIHPPKPQELKRGDLPEEWGIAVDQARENIAWTLQTLSPNALELSALWEAFQHKLLVDVQSPEFKAQEPIEMDAFQQYQTEVCERTKQSLWTVWVPKSAEVFRRTPPLYINGDAEAYYMSIAILQSNQLRTLVQDSMDTYRKFIEQHELSEKAMTPDPQEDTLLWSCKPAFWVYLMVTTEGGWTFQPSFRDVEDMCVNVLEQFVSAVSGIPRVGSASNAPSRRGMHIPAVGLNEDCVNLVRNKVRAVLQMNAEPPRKLASLYDRFLYLLTMDKDAEMKKFQEEQHSLEEYAAEIDKYRTAADEITNTSLNEVRTGLYVVHTSNLKEALITSAMDLSTRLIDQVREASQLSNQVICESYSLMSTEVMRVPASGEEVLTLKKYIQKCRTDHDELQKEIDFNKRREEFMLTYRTDLPEQDFSLAYHAYEWPKKMVVILKDATDKANTEHRSFEDQLKARRSAFNHQLIEYDAAITSFDTHGDKEARDKHSAQTNDLSNKLKEAQAEADEINAQEMLFGWPKSKFNQIASMVSRLDPYLSLWTICSSFHASYAVWMNGPFSRLDPEEIESDVGEMYRKIYKLCKFFAGASGAAELPEPLKVAQSTKEKIDKFRVYLPLISSICNPGLRERHWSQMSEVVGFELKRDEHTSLSRLLDRRVDEHMAKLQETSDFASREYSFEKMLDKMQTDWQGLTFELGPWKETGTFILKGGPVDEAQVLLDDHIVKSQAMTASPFAKPFEERLFPWEKKLVRLQDILEQWLKCQGKWLYLEPIFGSDEIMKQIPKEGAAFRDMDRTWRIIMTKTAENPDALVVADIENLLEDLQSCNACLDIVEKGLNDFLDTKKMAFPRFYFLSNDELLEILSEAKDPLKIQPFTRKIIEAVKELQFEEKNLISAMYSVEGEKVEFIKSVDPHESNAVEIWLTEVEAAMMNSLRKVACASVAAYANTARCKWILEWPGQMVLGISQIYWTKEVSKALTEGGSEGLRKHGDLCTSQLNDIVNLVRGELTKLERATLGALVTIDVHGRDVVVQMADFGVASTADFKWLSQLRYYMEDESIVVRMINAVAYYGYEYLGNSGRLVITPLTDRCYRTLMGAIHLNLGGAPAGPAGTGKTETVKDLSKAIAIQCIVFNCSDGLDYIAMGKFFKGLASSGAWACFDEFNRIELEVLSVVAQQVLTIQRAVAAKVATFMFEGIEIRLRVTCNAFITMNPGYAGRSELPDNLKALFRDVAMMVPDYALISEITLYSFGYLQARLMGQKLVQTYRLCSEQLSSQDHYDYGMRAVISVLRAAGNLKRKFQDEREDILMLRAITDVNLPKFLDQDVPLFNGILGDLFPGVVLPEADYKNLTDAMTENCAKNNLQPLPTLFEKIIQLYEMIIVRHGLMLVGESFGMKTSAYRILALTLTDLNKKGLNGEQHSKYYVLNPKSITMGQLYGADDPVSKEWTDGVLAVTFRSTARDTSPDRKWIIFDGPVDAIWIENMNTVLDDNKKLCLNSGEIIAMQGLMNMIFEVADLAVASPATVSRCGMVYVQPSLLGWRPCMVSWLATLSGGVTDAHKERMTAMFDWLVPPMVRVATRICKMMCPMQEINIVMSLMRLYAALLAPEFNDPNVIAEMNDNMVSVWLDSLFLFSLVWSLGGDLDDEGRKTFDKMLRRMLVGDIPAELKPYSKGTQQKVTQLFPEGRQVYDFTFDKGKGKWVPWVELIPDEPLSPELEYTKIIINTVDTMRYKFLVKTLATRHDHLLLVGPTGTGKSVYIKGLLMEDMGQPEVFTSLVFTFSAQTSANMTQDIIDGKLDKRRKGVYGPPIGKRSILFVDDLNMPQVEEYGAQPPIELLRQYMDHGGWYDRKELTFRQLVDIQFLAAMGPPGGGRNNVTNRYLRHYSVVSVTSFDAESMGRIFSVLAEWWIKKNDYGANIAKLRSPMVTATIDIYETVQRELLPTPMKSHYTFNLRDVSKVFQGVTYAKPGIEDPGEITRLWVHEVMRVFHDRLTDEPDRQWIVTAVTGAVEKHFKERFVKVMQRLDADRNNSIDSEELRYLMFGDFLIPGAEPQLYEEILDSEKLLSVVQEYLSDYNAVSKKPMDLVLFLYALEHMCRVCRIIKQAGGHALLVGVGGSGRQSLTRLSCFMEEYEVFQIEISKSYGMVEWREDLKKVMRIAGESDKRVTFLFTDTQIKDERFVEDISNLLNTGEVPNLMEAGDTVQIFENIGGRAKANGVDRTNKALMYNFFVDEVKKNLHVVLAFSPVGETFRERLRKFPALVNCCTIDWFTAWPYDALKSVSGHFLNDLQGIEPAVCESVMEMCVTFHQTAHALVTRFLAEARRYYYITPTSYLELIRGFKKVLDLKRSECLQASKRYEVGLEKLVSTESQVSEMQEELEALQPQLIQSGKETEAAMVVIARETTEADKVKVVVAKEEAVASGEAAKVMAIKDDCEAQLAEAMPMLDAAIKALDTLTKNEVTEVKGMKSPPKPVKLVLEAVCILKGLKASRVKDPGSGKMVDDFWETSKKMLSDADFLASLRVFDKDNIPPAIIVKIRPYVANPDFDPVKIRTASTAAFGLCCWVRAMEAYDRVAKVVAPKKASLAEAEGALEKVMAALRIKQAELKEVEDKLAALDADLKVKQDNKAKLEADVELCTVKLDRAEKLIEGLGGEKIRWTESAQALQEKLPRITGDVLISSGSIAYLGAFNAGYRDETLDKWLELCKEKEIPCSQSFSLNAVLGEPVKIRAWNIQGLPKDEFSTDNAIMMDMARRWSLCIDPASAANKWIRGMWKEAGLLVIKLTDGDYLRTLENAVQFGKPVLLENIGETMDASLEPLLDKQTFKQGGAMCIRLGDATVEYSSEFRFYITTKLRNPHYPPELCTKVTLLNFMITIEGLEDQLLGLVVAKERPDLEEEKSQLVVEGAENKRQLKEIEDKILHVLSASQGNILEDEEAVKVLSASKVLSDQIAEKQKVAEVTEVKIDEARVGYKPIAKHSALLYFCVQDMANIDPMYQYSVTWFSLLFSKAITDSTKSDDLSQRLTFLQEYFTYFLFVNVCRSLFEKDKVLFAFVLASKLQISRGLLDPAELRFLLTGGVDTGENPHANPAPDWISTKSWGEICRLSDLPCAQGLLQDFQAAADKFKGLYNVSEAHLQPLPSPWQEKMNVFQRLLVVRAMRPDKVVPGITIYVEKTMTKKFVEPQPFDIAPCYTDSSAAVPLIFVLSQGTDPMAGLLKFADGLKIRVESVSLGQGQGPVALKLIGEAITGGHWVVLQNCHLAKSFMSALDRVCEIDIKAPEVNKDFRLWMTSYPSPLFPITVLENGVKMVNEAPKGLRAGLMRTYMSDPVSDPDFFYACTKEAEWRKMLFGLAFFHSYANERRKYGPIGFNIPYEFNENDLRISLRQLQMFLDENEEVPYETVQYTAGECNYGGKVTDAHDRHTLMVILRTFYTPEILDDDYKFSPSGIYKAPAHTDYKGYLDYINSLPIIASPEVYGLHDNADISKDILDTNTLLDALLLTQSRDSGAAKSKDGEEAKSPEDLMFEMASDIVERIPPNFDVEAVEMKYPADYYDSMTTVLVQELARVNTLVTIVRASLLDIRKAVRGMILSSDVLDMSMASINNGKVPAQWLKKSFPSLKPLGSYIKELLERINFFQTWVDKGKPSVYWLSGFFFTQAFLTASKQNFARVTKVEIDKIDFDYEMMDQADDYDEPPEHGIYTRGLFFDGAGWDYVNHVICESKPKVLYVSVPVIWMVPKTVEQFKTFKHYSCPLYKTGDRRGVLATTGHSSNFIMDLRVPIDQTPEHWSKRGVAMLTSLSD
ncbi:hypothetical protein CYMTET_29517 [Cymbomonas tetramitiformis]|uniref:Dynein axonemal heavy chain 7 n=1 Tax=Cymbomonas tetramitiformis TaxID=36881 RepID=A0AAE0FKU4_9CHLO|nr:hypothetical protein CYMTET_29517 [Cymbomonas tetramitiformis]